MKNSFQHKTVVMHKVIKPLWLVILCLVLTSSCKTDHSISSGKLVKRKHTKGYYISKRDVQNSMLGINGKCCADQAISKSVSPLEKLEYSEVNSPEMKFPEISDRQLKTISKRQTIRLNKFNIKSEEINGMGLFKLNNTNNPIDPQEEPKPEKKKTNVYVIIGFIFSILGLTILPILGSIAGYLLCKEGLEQIAIGGGVEKGHNLGLAGKIISIIGLVMAIIFILLMFLVLFLVLLAFGI